jgi:hypothetical protein
MPLSSRSNDGQMIFGLTNKIVDQAVDLRFFSSGGSVQLTIIDYAGVLVLARSRS